MDKEDTRPIVKECSMISKEDADKKIDEFTPVNSIALEMYECVQKLMGLSKIIAVEVDHCPQSYACLLVSDKGGNNIFGPSNKILYSGDTMPC